MFHAEKEKEITECSASSHSDQLLIMARDKIILNNDFQGVARYVYLSDLQIHVC